MISRIREKSRSASSVGVIIAVGDIVEKHADAAPRNERNPSGQQVALA
ncbi:MAG: hypothetical protein WBO82_09900 [Neisseria sp.]